MCFGWGGQSLRVSRLLSLLLFSLLGVWLLLALLCGETVPRSNPEGGGGLQASPFMRYRAVESTWPAQRNVQTYLKETCPTPSWITHHHTGNGALNVACYAAERRSNSEVACGGGA